MSFSESLFWFKEPGFVGILFICFLSEFFVSAKSPKGIQIFIAAYCSVYIVTQWSKDDYFSMGLWWMYCGWAGFLFHKLGGMNLLAGIGRITRNRFDSMGRHAPQPEPNQQFQQQASTSSNSDREESYRQQQEEYRQREWQREQQRRQDQRQAEQAAKEQRQAKEKRQQYEQQQKQSAYQDRASQKSKTAPNPEATQKETPPPKQPKPKPQRKRLWWEVLDVSENADLATIKKAYRTLIQKYHPDRVSHLGEEFQAIAEEKTKEINGAFDQAKK